MAADDTTPAKTSAEDRTQSSYLSSIGIGNLLPSINDITSYSQSIKSLTVGRNNRTGLAKDTVTFVKFDKYTFSKITHQFLIIGTATGFQVFLLDDSRDLENASSNQNIGHGNVHQSPNISNKRPTTHSTRTSNTRKKFHKRALFMEKNLEIIKVAPKNGKQIPNAISCATILCEANPNLEAFGENKNSNMNFNYDNGNDNDKISSEFDNGSENGPIIAVSPTNKHDPHFGHKCVRLYSLMDQQYIMVHRFRTKVHGIASCPNALVIALERQIVVKHPFSKETLFHKSCAPNPIQGAVMALGNRWIALADTKLHETFVEPHLLPQMRKKKKISNSQTSSYHNSPNIGKSGKSIKNHDRKQRKKGKKHSKHSKHNKHSNPKQRLKHATSTHISSSMLDAKNESKNSIDKGSGDDDNDYNNSSDDSSHDLSEYDDIGEEEARTIATSKDLQSNTTMALTNYATDVSQSLMTMGSTVASGMATGIYQISGKSSQRFTQYLKKSGKSLKDSVNQQTQRLVDSASNALDYSNSSMKNENNSIVAGYNSIYSSAPPKEGIVSIVDIVKGDYLLNFVAHSNAPLIYLAFDPSGSLLVTADREGQFLNVFQIIAHPIESFALGHGIKDEEKINDGQQGGTTIYKHLYRIFRGFTYALIRDISFTMDSRWMSVTSARGTTHIYAINREGGKATYQSHNCIDSWQNNNGCSDEQSSVTAMELPGLIEISSIHKLHHLMEEKRDNIVTGSSRIAVMFSSIGHDTPFGHCILVQSPIGLTQYTMTTASSLINDENETGGTLSNIIGASTLDITGLSGTNSETSMELFTNISKSSFFSSFQEYSATSVSYPYLHSQLYPSMNNGQIAPLISLEDASPHIGAIGVKTRHGNEMNDEMELHNRINIGTPALGAIEAPVSKLLGQQINSNNEDTKRWLSNVELFTMNDYNQVSLWSNPQFEFFTFDSENENENGKENENDNDSDYSQSDNENENESDNENGEKNGGENELPKTRAKLPNDRFPSFSSVEISPEPGNENNNNNNNDDNDNNGNNYKKDNENDNEHNNDQMLKHGKSRHGKRARHKIDMNNETIDPFAFLDLKPIHNAKKILLQDHTPLLESHVAEPEITNTVNDVQQSIMFAIGSTIEPNRQETPSVEERPNTISTMTNVVTDLMNEDHYKEQPNSPKSVSHSSNNMGFDLVE